MATANILDRMRWDPKQEESFAKYETLMAFAKSWVPGWEPKKKQEAQGVKPVPNPKPV